MVSLAVSLSAIIVAIAAGNAEQGKPPWHTWLASLVVVGVCIVFVAAFVWVGRNLATE